VRRSESAPKGRGNGSRRAGGLPITAHVSTDSRTQELSHLPPVIFAVDDDEADVGADTPRPIQVTGEESAQRMYEAGLAKLAALHDGWAAAIAELGKAPNAPDAAAA
jgi:hypothetical protein